MSSCTLRRVHINPEQNEIIVMNDGKGIPVEVHKKEKMYVPELIFGHLLTSSNYDDEEQKVTGGRNGYGAKLANIFSTKFIVETLDKNVCTRSVFATSLFCLPLPLRLVARKSDARTTRVPQLTAW
jgi:DNA gyrase/topoisomerase IV subunit B